MTLAAEYLQQNVDCFAVSVRCPLSASSAKHASLFPLPEGRHLFGNFREENAGSSSRSVVWKQKLS